MNQRTKTSKLPFDLQIAKNLWDRGASMGEIAAMFEGATRGSVGGMIHRNRALFARHSDRPKLVKPEPKKLGPPTGKYGWINKARLPKPVSPPIIIDPQYDAARLPFAKPMMDLDKCECRWPVSDTPYLFCAEETKKTYCEQHHARSRKS